MTCKDSLHRSQVLTYKELFTNMVVDLHRSLEKVIEAAETKSAASLAAVDLHRLQDSSPSTVIVTV